MIGVDVLTFCRAQSRISATVLFPIVGMERGCVMLGFEYQVMLVANMTKEKERAVSSRVDMGRPIRTRWISVTKNQKAWNTVMMLWGRISILRGGG